MSRQEEDHLSDHVEATLRKIGLDKDELDLPDFDPVEYINSKFPGETNLQAVDTFLLRCDQETQELNEDIRVTVREQALAGTKVSNDLSAAKQSIIDLYSQIQGIKTKAEASENMVQEICKDIKQLDVAKRNLTQTINTLQKFKMLVTSVDFLEEAAESRQYKDVGHLLSAVTSIYDNFKDYADVPKVVELGKRVDAIKKQVREQVVADFSNLTSVGLLNPALRDDDGYGEHPDDAVGSPETLAHLCQVVDSMPRAMRNQIIDSLCERYAAVMESTFPTSEPEEALQGMGPRYLWIRRTVVEVETHFAEAFPPYWRAEHRVALALAQRTQRDLERMLSTFDPPDSVPAAPLVAAVTATLQFEREMAKKFEATPLEEGKEEEGDRDEEEGALMNTRGEMVPRHSVEGIKMRYNRQRAERKRQGRMRAGTEDRKAWYLRLGASGDTAMELAQTKQQQEEEEEEEMLPPFHGLISGVFDPYMGAYIQAETADMQGMVREVGTMETFHLEDSSKDFRSSRRFFMQARNAISRCVKLNTGPTFLLLFKRLRELLLQYADGLQQRVPMVTTGKDKDMDVESVAMKPEGGTEDLCFVINTCQYCADTIPAMEDAFKGKIDENLKGHVSFEDPRDKFMDLIANGLKILALGLAGLCDPALTAMTKMPWATLTQVGDQSEYVFHLHNIIGGFIPTIRDILPPQLFTTACDKFVRAFVPRFLAAIFRCKRIGELGATQLSIDANAIKTFLLQTPVLGQQGGDKGVPPMFTRTVSREFPRIELLLKVVAIPKDRLVDSIQAFWTEASGQEVQKVAELKGMKKSETRELLDALNLQATSGSSKMKRVLESSVGALGKAFRKKQ